MRWAFLIGSVGIAVYWAWDLRRGSLDLVVFAFSFFLLSPVWLPALADDSWRPKLARRVSMSSGAVLLAMVAAWVVASFGDERSPGFPASLIAFALALTGAWHLCRSNRLPTVTRGLGLTTGLSLAGLASIALGGWAPYAVQQAWRAHEIAWYRGMVPASLGVERALAIDVENRITEGCGVAVFQLSRGTVSRLTLNGLAELGLARQARDHHDGRHTYSQWRKTPFVETGSWVDDRWTYATNCATHMDRQLIDSIGTALHSPGSYYASIHEAGLLVVPSLGLVVFLLHG